MMDEIIAYLNQRIYDISENLTSLRISQVYPQGSLDEVINKLGKEMAVVSALREKIGLSYSTAEEVVRRMEYAMEQCHNSQYWHEEEYGEGMSYMEWIKQPLEEE